MSSQKILLIGASGQIGAELTTQLRENYGAENIIAADIKNADTNLTESGPFETLNVLDKKLYAEIINKYKITQIYNLAALLSATAEKFPLKAWQLNMDGLFNTLEIAKENKIKKVYWPSSIAAFGPDTPKKNAGQLTVMNPDTMYGITKLSGELLCAWYHKNYNLDIRSLRYPGLISYKTEPGGGTTDYAVDIYFKAKKEKKYTCFIAENTMLPMMYMPDAIRATIELMEADADKIKIRTSYNINAMSFSPQMIALSIQKSIPEFKIEYEVDYRQKIAEGWPASIDDSQARKDWNWKHVFTLDAMTKDMLEHVPAF